MQDKSKAESAVTTASPSSNPGAVQRSSGWLRGMSYEDGASALAPVQKKDGDPPQKTTVGGKKHGPPEWTLVSGDRELIQHWRKIHPDEPLLEAEFADVFAKDPAENAAEEATMQQINALFDPMNQKLLSKVDGMRPTASTGKTTGTPGAPEGAQPGGLSAMLDDQGYRGTMKDTGKKLGSANAPMPNNQASNLRVDHPKDFGVADGVSEADIFQAQTGIPIAGLQVVDYSILVDDRGQKLYTGIFGFPVKAPVVPRDKLWIDETETGGVATTEADSAPPTSTGGGKVVRPVLGAKPAAAAPPPKDYTTVTTWWLVSANGEKQVADGPGHMAQKRAQLAAIRAFYANRAALIAQYSKYLK